MDLLIIILLVIAGVVLLLIELFLIPGTSLAAFISGACFIYAVYHAFTYIGAAAGFLTLAVSAIAGIVAVVWFMRSKTLDKVALKKDIEGKVDRDAEHRVKVGDQGVAVTRLALFGQAEINGDLVEVKSCDGFLNPKTPIKVVRINDGNILVEKL